MTKGIIYALIACFIWGLIFVVPQFMEGFNSLEVALGRYFFYGIFSSIILAKIKWSGTFQYPSLYWRKALVFSLITTVGYYPFVVLSLRYSSPAICALILGISPITIAFYGNWKMKECDFRTLFFPAALILLGMIIINVPQFIGEFFPTSHLLGLIYALLALVTWTWYAVANAKILKNHPELASSDWSTMIGVGTFLWVLIFAAFIGIFFHEHVEIDKYITFNAVWIKFIGGSAVLGFICSWVGAYLWNKASFYLPVSLAGQLMIFETIFGLVFVYAIEQRLPPMIEFFGIAFLLTAIIYGLRVSYQKNPHAAIA
jgi:drug/metabolite transporter (DMT)-like permease